jgi:hypothetical protein
MNKKWLAIVLIVPVLAAGALYALPVALPGIASQPQAADRAIDSAARHELVDTLIARLNAHYVFPTTARKIEQLLRARLQRGDYEHIASARAIAQQLTRDMASVAHDLRLDVRFGPNALPPQPERPATLRWIERRFAKSGVDEVRRYVPDIGYLGVSSFDRADLAAPRYRAAMDKIDGTGAVIVDLRGNVGGDPAALRLFASYFVDRPIMFKEIRYRDADRSAQVWTLRKTPVPPHLGKMYILTSRATRAEGEEFAYTMQALGRATIVGERTAGSGAHSGATYRLASHFIAAIPSGRAVSPVTGTNWEGVGVAPDIQATSDAALRTTLKIILTDRLAHATTPMAKIELRKMLDEL